MRASSLMSIYTLVGNIYRESTNNLSKQLADIHIIQHENTGSPKFFYKGEVYMASSANTYSVNPIYPPLAITFDSYRKQYNIIMDKKHKLNLLLKKFTEVNTLCDLAYVVPKEAFIFLDNSVFINKDDFIMRSPEYIENIDKSLSHEINLLIKEQLLHTLLL